MSLWRKIVVSVKYVSLNYIYFLLLVDSLAILIAVPVVFSHSRTLLAEVLKMLCISNIKSPCIPHRSRLFWFNSPDIMEFSSWKRFIMWSILYNLLCKGSMYFDCPEYWMSAICLAKLWKTVFCPRSVW